MISIIIPVYNERESLRTLLEEIQASTRLANLEAEILFVDDGSTDASWDVLRDIVSLNDNVRAVRFRRNFGKAAALSAGFARARGDVFLTLDADLQDDPAEIPRFVATLGTSYDVVSGWKKTRLDPWHKVWPSRVFNALVGWLTKVRLHDHNCGMKCYRAEVFKEVRLYGELHRFVPVLAAARGFRVGELVINHRARRFGVSKYGMGRFIKGFLDLLTVKFLTGFEQRPQHLLGGIGLTSFLLGVVGLLYLGVTWIINVYSPGSFLPLHQRPLLIYAAAALVTGGQMMSIGFLAELVTAYLGGGRENYSVAEEVGKR